MLSPETLEWLRQTARQGHSYSLAHLDHVERTDALRESLETALKRITALESFFERAEAAVAPLLAGGPLPAGAAWTEREGREVFTARPASCPAAEADEPDDEPQTLHSVALRMVETLSILPEIKRTLRRAIREPMGSAPAAAAAPVATDDELRWIWEETPGIPQAFRAIYSLGRAHGTPPAMVEALQKAEAALSGAGWPSSQALNALPAIRAALQLLGQSAPAAAPEPEAPQAEAEAQPAEDAAPAWGLVEKIAFTACCGNGTSRAVIREVAAWLDRRGNRGSANELREQCAISQGERGGAMTEPLSPAAQAVLDAVLNEAAPLSEQHQQRKDAAAAIRALVEQTVPADSLFCSIGRFNADLALEVVRNKQLAIAAELEGGATTPTTPQEAQ